MFGTRVLGGDGMVFQKKQLKTIIFMTGILITIFIIGSFYTGYGMTPSDYSVKADSLVSSNRSKHAVKVMVEKGDTLWEIAAAYYSHEYKDINTLVQEIKDCNGITSDIIHEGNYLIVPYYETERDSYKMASSMD